MDSETSNSECEDSVYNLDNKKTTVKGKGTGGKTIVVEKEVTVSETPQSDCSQMGDSDEESEEETFKPAAKKKKAATKAKKEPKKAADNKKTKKGKKNQETIKEEDEGKKTKVDNKTSKTTKISKETKKGDGDMREVILKYFKDNNKPYNSTTIYENLKRVYSKPQINKLLEKLVEEKLLSDKGGKNNVYWYNQDLQEVGDVEALEIKFKELENGLKQKEINRTKTQNELSKIAKQPDDDKLQKEIDEFMEKEAILNSEIGNLKSIIGEVSEEQLDKDAKFMGDFDIEFKKINKEVKDRKILFKDLFGMQQESTEMRKNEQCNELDIVFQFEDQLM